MTKKTCRNLSLVLCAALATGCMASASVNVQSGYFFNHDLRHSRSVVFVLDLSGSMNGESGAILENAGTDVAAKAAGGLVGGLLGKRAGNVAEDRLKRLKKKIEKVKLHLIASLHGLPDGASFNIILFNGSVQKLSPLFIEANGVTTALVSAFVDRLEANGSTNIYEALDAAIADAPEHVILLTDGMPTSTSPEAIIGLAREWQTRHQFAISTVGVGTDQARHFLSALAQENGGTYEFFN